MATRFSVVSAFVGFVSAWLSFTAAPSAAEIQRVALTVPKADTVLVTKSKRRLELLSGGQVIKSYFIALGRNPVGHKTREGDGRTPEGSYVLDWRNPNSRFYRSIHVSYPGPADLRRARRKGVSPGGAIMIHGLPNDEPDIGWAHALRDWTEGCIAVTNAQMDEIWQLVDDGTPIVILP